MHSFKCLFVRDRERWPRGKITWNAVALAVAFELQLHSKIRYVRFFRIDFLPLILQSEHIQIFPITVASTFVTLSWNSSGALSTGRGYILQVSQKSSTASPKVVPRTRQVGRCFLTQIQSACNRES